MAQVYTRISNPYQPNGTPNLTNAPSPYYAPGELGCTFNDQNTGNDYLRVQLDSGATNATAVGAVLAGQVAYWKNMGTATVTNDKRQCDVGPLGAQNRIAGIFSVAPTVAPGVNGSDGNPLLYMTDLVLRSAGPMAVAVSGTPAAGGIATGNNSVDTANCVSTAVNTAAPGEIVGVWTSATVTNNTAPCLVNIQFAE
jgi:hypothetical protein